MIGTPHEVDGAPGTLKPRALAAIAALFGARERTLSAWRIAAAIGDPDALYVVPLMHAMAELGLVERFGRGVGYASRWRLLVEGPRLAAARLP